MLRIQVPYRDSIIPIQGVDNVLISAKNDINIDALIDTIKKKIFADTVIAKLLVPFTKGDVSSYICQKAQVNKMDYRAEGTYFEVELKEADYQRLKTYEITE